MAEKFWSVRTRETTTGYEGPYAGEFSFTFTPATGENYSYPAAPQAVNVTATASGVKFEPESYAHPAAPKIVQVSDSAAYSTSRAGITTATANITDVATYSTSRVGSATATIDVSDTAAYLINRTDGTSSSVQVSASASGKKASSDVVSEVIGISTDSLLYPGETVFPGENIYPNAQGAKAVSANAAETIQVSESVTTASSQPQHLSDIVSETVDVNDFAVGAANYAGQVQETITVSEAATSQKSTSNDTIEVVPITESATVQKAGTDTTTETMQVAISASGTVLKSSNISDVVPVSTTALGAKNASDSVSETILVSEATTRVRGTSGFITANIEVSEVAAVTSVRAGIASNAITVSVLLQGEKAASVSVAEIIQVSESATYFIPQHGGGATQAVVQVSSTVDWTTTKSGVTSTEIAAVDTVAITASRSGEVAPVAVIVSGNLLTLVKREGITTAVVAVSVIATGKAAFQPSNIQVYAVDASTAIVEWVDSPSANSHKVEREKWSGTDWVEMNTFSAASSPLIDDSLQPDTRYRYRVGAVHNGD